jgi:hypothetical protein
MVVAVKQVVQQRDPIAPMEARSLPRQSDAALSGRPAKHRALVLLFTLSGIHQIVHRCISAFNGVDY